MTRFIDILDSFCKQGLLIRTRWGDSLTHLREKRTRSPEFWQRDADSVRPCIVFYPQLEIWQIIKSYGDTLAYDIKNVFQLYEALAIVNPEIIRKLAEPQ
jgi:hypothetical protein